MEVLVALILGLLTTVVITQVTGAFEGQKRSTMSGGDAQTAGSTALYFIERDTKNAGFGIAVPGALGCQLKGTYDKGGAAVNIDWRLAPVLIENGAGVGAASIDSLTILASNRMDFSLPASSLAAIVPASSIAYTDSVFGINQNDILAIWQEGAPHCSLVQATTACNADAYKTVAACQTDKGVALDAKKQAVPHVVMDVAGDWNPSDPTTLYPAGGYKTYSKLFNLGTIQRISYVVNNGSLIRREFQSATNQFVDTPVMDNVVNMQAQYGRDTDGNGIVENWTAVSPTTAAEWQQVIAIRLAVVARSTQFEKQVVTGPNPPQSPLPTWKDGAIAVDFLADWDHYRYRTFETVIPLRNRLWGLS